MFRPRVIPILLLKGKGLVKSVKFKNYNYIGDPINAVKIFNDLKVDELVLLDILATKENRTISLDFVLKVGDEANMPFAVGGGLKTTEEIKNIINAGAEKVIINSYASVNPDFVKKASDIFGSSTIVVSIDVKSKIFGNNQVYSFGGTKSTGYFPIEYARLMEKKGAGEIIINSIEHDGMMKGYHIDLVAKLAKSIHIPVVAVGGAGNLNHMSQVLKETYISAVGAGSMFVFHGPRNAVLVNYPTQEQLKSLIRESII